MTSSFSLSRSLHVLVQLLVMMCTGGTLAVIPLQAMGALTLEYQQGSLPLAQALLRISRQFGITVVFDPDLVQHYRSAPVNGTLSVEQALQAALQGTGLSLKQAPNGSYTVDRNAAPISSARSSEEADSSTPLLKPIIVQGERDKTGYATEETRSATRTSTPLLELSQSVSSVSRALLDDQQSLTVLDALRNVSSVTQSFNPGSQGPSVNVRGFTVENAMTDGLPSSGNLAFLTPTIALERIDVIKGPESVIGGTTTAFGGAVNLVFKRPEAKTVRQLQSTVDSKGRRQLGLDINGALNDTRELRGRLVLSGDKHGDTVLGADGGHDVYIAPALGWKDTTNNLVVGLEAQNAHNDLGNYIYFRGSNISKDYTPAYPDKGSTFESQRRRTYFDYERNLGSAWKLGLRGQYLEQASSGDSLQELVNLPIGNKPLTVNSSRTDMSYRDRSVQANIAKTLSLGGAEHRLMLGFDYLKSSLNSRVASELQRLVSNSSGNVERGVFVQDQINLWEKLHLKLALRHISFKSISDSGTPPLSKTTPSVGIVYQYTPTNSVYASYSKGVERPQGVLSRTGTALPPTEASQKEVGIKNTFFDDKLVLTTALFDISKINVPKENLASPGTYYITNEVRSRGMEIELNGRITPALSISAAYTNTFPERIRSGTARHTLSLWGVYRFQDKLRGWNVGGGVQARSAVDNDVPEYDRTIHNPGNTRIDLTAGYEALNWSAKLGIRNLTDRTLFAATSGAKSDITYAILEPERTVTLTGTFNF